MKSTRMIDESWTTPISLEPWQMTLLLLLLVAIMLGAAVGLVFYFNGRNKD